jgi:predicted tellurium resistance membrane protein TerC
MQVGRALLFVGLAIAACGLLWMVGSKLGLGRLPGDIVIEKKNYSFYFPVVTSVVVSLVLTLLFNLFRK